jgi:hypothetical protein
VPALTTPRPRPTRSSQSSGEYYPSRKSDSDLVQIPTKNWDEVIKRVNKLWKPEFAPHHSIFGQNGSGKTHLITHGLLPLCQGDNVCIFDNKGDDPVINAAGAKRVRALPSKLRRTLDNDKPKDGWFQLVVHEDVPHAQDQVGRALEQIYKEGNWIVVLDETRAISDPRSPGLGLQPLLDRMWLRGRSRHISVVAATQAPRWVPTSFYDQCQFAWCSRIRDERAHQRVMEIGSMTRAHIPHIARIRKRRWLYMDDEEDETWLAETGL